MCKRSPAPRPPSRACVLAHKYRLVGVKVIGSVPVPRRMLRIAKRALATVPYGGCIELLLFMSTCASCRKNSKVSGFYGTVKIVTAYNYYVYSISSIKTPGRLLFSAAYLPVVYWRPALIRGRRLFFTCTNFARAHAPFDAYSVSARGIVRSFALS